MTPTLTIHAGDALTVLRGLPDGSVNCCVTSPPYWGLRDYGVAGQMGLESTPAEYVERMVDVFREVRRVLREDGTCWVNLGSSYAGAGNGGGGSFASERPGWSVFGGTGPIPSPWRERAPACDKDGTELRDSHVAGRACPYCGGELQDGYSIRRAYIARIAQLSEQDAQQPLRIDRDSELSDSSSASPGVSAPDAGRSTTRASFRRDRAACVPAGAASEHQTTDSTSPGCAQPFAHRKVCTSGTAQREHPSAFRTSDTGFFCTACGYCTNTFPQFKPKDMVPIPWMVAMALQADGWWLRQDIIWHKPNPMPESVTDRCTKAHEYLFLLTKAARYYWNQEAMQEDVSGKAHRRCSVHSPAGWATVQGPHTSVEHQRNGRHRKTVPGVTPKSTPAGQGVKSNESFHAAVTDLVQSRNRRSVWTVPSEPYKEAHFATYPPDLIKPCIMAGCPVGGTVLDPFGGSGTTGQVALELGRSAVLIELNPEYVTLARRRTNVTPGLQLA